MDIDKFIKDVLSAFTKNKQKILRRIKKAKPKSKYVDLPFVAQKICLARYNTESKKFVHIEVLLAKDVKILINLL